MSSIGKAEDVMNGLRLVIDACEVIRDKDRCSECPIGCIDNDSFYEMGDCVSKRKWTEFFDLAEKCDNDISEDDYISLRADDARKGERDEQYIDSLYGI